jgi:hypothetical protein
MGESRCDERQFRGEPHAANAGAWTSRLALSAAGQRSVTELAGPQRSRTAERRGVHGVSEREALQHVDATLSDMSRP